MASGTPVILSRSSALPEVAGGAGLYIESFDDVACASAIELLIEDQPQWAALRAAGLERAKDFTWTRCANITAAVYRELLGH